MRPLSASVSADAAEALAAEALAWLAGQEDLLGAFLNASGSSLAELRQRLDDPEFLGFVLDFLLGDEPALLAFCETSGVHPETPLRARAMLPGGGLPHWT